MESNKRQCYYSQPFQFIIGPDRVPMFLHSSAVTSVSVPLQRMIDGNFKEAHEHCVIIEDVDEGTFVCFCDYVYHGKYTPEDHILASETKTSSCTEDRGFNPFTNSTDDVDFIGQFEARQYTPRDSSFQPRKNEPGEDIYNTMLESHARVYVFADRYDIPDLKQLALFNLHKTLLGFQLYKSNVPDIIRLAEFCFSDENTMSSEAGKLDPLRDLIANYLACIVTEFKDVGLPRGEEGSFERQLVRLMIDRICEKSEKIRELTQEKLLLDTELREKSDEIARLTKIVRGEQSKGNSLFRLTPMMPPSAEDHIPHTRGFSAGRASIY